MATPCLSNSWIFLLLILSFAVPHHGCQTLHRQLLAGGWQAVDPKSSNIQELAQFAIAQYNANLSGTGIKLVYSTVLAAKEQVVAGMKYWLVIQTSNGNIYEATVWERAWEHFRSLQSFDRVRTVPGGFVYRDPSSKTIQKLGEFAVEEYNNKLGRGQRKINFVKVVEAKSQVVGGFRYAIVIEASDGLLYKATVVERTWERTQKLESFKMVEN